jgi:hypothetical protein
MSPDLIVERSEPPSLGRVRGQGPRAARDLAGSWRAGGPAHHDSAPGALTLSLARDVVRDPATLARHRERVDWHLSRAESRQVDAALLDAFRGLPPDARDGRRELLRLARRVLSPERLRWFEEHVEAGVSPSVPAAFVEGTVLATGFGPDGIALVRRLDGGDDGGHRGPPDGATRPHTGEARRRRARVRTAVLVTVALVAVVGGALVVLPALFGSGDGAREATTATAPATSPITAVTSAPEDPLPGTDDLSPTVPASRVPPDDEVLLSQMESPRRGSPEPTLALSPDDPEGVARSFAEHWAWLLANPDPQRLTVLLSPHSAAHAGADEHLDRLAVATEAVELTLVETRGHIDDRRDDRAWVILEMVVAEPRLVDATDGAVLRPAGPDGTYRLRLELERLDDGRWRVAEIGPLSGG